MIEIPRSDMHHQGDADLLLPVVGEAPAALWELVRDGQAVVLTRDGSPALVVLDIDSYRETELAAEGVP